ncbi:2,5-diamino-6-ribosylamino-4(3H)-pyrimidinone 5'-phosphate reductase [Psilocybe cubensis]|uniref:2,5-diamino-6-ribosylamino-4(3H)-pyrimidinone 5'-phosphate reductase n=2 Tax=Psilocybe cubensis TaxID=181762 RepID=A0ACB8HE32_PSICU|nr:2,5-diamino-6-ribosylamino-4(3H)-pyrimidinone 5'-phosphate reductase [Psilocybe cubensis]KAH9486265.1 2,5-diamino-6-ribosylamino-4(3H)-pyrimidinone 5'-phosphate reductase [Psilocybe cubensis]
MNMAFPEFLKNVVGRYQSSPIPLTRPRVTLTFAQSLDAKIAGAGRRQLILSGKESMLMTHWMRTMHDAILVGIGTAINDDPQLNVRHLPPPTSTPHHLPRPIIIDTHLRLSPTCKLLRNFQNGIGRRPWILCGENSLSSQGHDIDKQARMIALIAAGAKILEVAVIPSEDRKTGIVSIANALKTLKDHGVQTLMVEGGAQIIASFLSEAVVDSLIITTAPVLVGDAGVGYTYPANMSDNGESLPKYKEVHTELFGRDFVTALLCTPTML